MKKFYSKILMLLFAAVYSAQSNATITTITVDDFQFTPSTVNAFVGDTIHFVWIGGSHNTTCDGSGGSSFPAGAATWASPMNSSVPTFDYVLQVAGTYHYVCTFHPGMAGDINATIPPNPLVNITFRVDLSQVDSICSGGPHIAGAFNGWSTTLNPLTSIGAGIYEATIALDSTQSYQYKFLKDDAFSVCGDETVPGACSVGGNREIIVPESDSVLATVCFSSCTACMPIGFADITFSVDMSQTILGAGGPHLAGSFNGFSTTATPMTDIGGGIYQATVNLDTSLTVQYTFLKDSSFIGQETVPALCGVPNGVGGFNRELVVPDNDTTLSIVCYGSCVACPPLVGVTFRVDMAQTTVSAGGVHVAGSFNGFSPTANLLQNVVGSVYRKKVFLPAGSTIQYLFLKDSTFTDQEIVPSLCGVPDTSGIFYRELTVPLLLDTVLDAVCYSSCSACIVAGFADITFNVDMTNETVSPAGVHLAGSFNGFSATANPMINIIGNIYSATVNIDTSLTVQYTFLNDSTFTGQEIVPASCGVPDSSGVYYRELVMPEIDSTLAAVCFSGCGACASPGFTNVTFSVDLSQDTICAGAPHIAGSFNAWSATANPLDSMGNGIYQTTIQLAIDSTYEYKFFNDTVFGSPCGDEIVPIACSNVNGNREIDIPANDTILPLVCFGSCSACVPVLPADSALVTFSVDLSQDTICGGGPHIAGSFNGWSATATPLDSMGNGIYEKTLLLAVDTVYEYKFYNDTVTGTPCGDEIVPVACSNANGNREFMVPVNDTILATVCYGSCAACVPPPKVNVTFSVDMSVTSLGSGGPHYAGTYNGFFGNVTPMTLVGNNIYSVTLALDTGHLEEFIFLKDSTFTGAEIITIACGVPNGSGGFNRFMNTLQTDTVLPAFCYGSCSVCFVGIDDHSGDNVVSVYPNPTENILYVETAAIPDNFNLRLLSMDGKLLFDKEVSGGYQQTIAIDMSGFAKGIYVLKVESAKGTSVQKVTLK